MPRRDDECDVDVAGRLGSGVGRGHNLRYLIEVLYDGLIDGGRAAKAGFSAR